MVPVPIRPPQLEGVVPVTATAGPSVLLKVTARTSLGLQPLASVTRTSYCPASKPSKVYTVSVVVWEAIAWFGLEIKVNA